MRITAPQMGRGDTVTVHLRRMPFDDWTQQLARQLGAVAVYRSDRGAIELIRKADLPKEVFSKNALKEGFETAFVNARIGDAIRSIASSAGIDIVAPEGLEGRVTLNLPRTTWREAMEAVLESSGNPGGVRVDANGLARIVP